MAALLLPIAFSMSTGTKLLRSRASASSSIGLPAFPSSSDITRPDGVQRLAPTREPIVCQLPPKKFSRGQSREF